MSQPIKVVVPKGIFTMDDMQKMTAEALWQRIADLERQLAEREAEAGAMRAALESILRTLHPPWPQDRMAQTALVEAARGDADKARAPNAGRVFLERLERAEEHVATLEEANEALSESWDRAMAQVKREALEEAARVADKESELLQGGTFLCPPEEKLWRTASRIAAEIRALAQSTPEDGEK